MANFGLVLLCVGTHFGPFSKGAVRSKERMQFTSSPPPSKAATALISSGPLRCKEDVEFHQIRIYRLCFRVWI